MIIERKVRLKYPQHLLDQPLIYALISDFRLFTNILEAQVDAEQGMLVVVVRGQARDVDQGLAWLEGQGVEVEVLSEGREGQ
ncbi:MAG TPA: hypothetical protein ENO24_00795 [Chloroflexi bacterium]|nr:hypothetical protein [Chloroflexota bacterium]